MSDHVSVPWTDAQVAELIWYQRKGVMYPCNTLMEIAEGLGVEVTA